MYLNINIIFFSLRSRVRGHLRLYLAYLRQDGGNDEIDESPNTEDVQTEVEEVNAVHGVSVL